MAEVNEQTTNEVVENETTVDQAQVEDKKPEKTAEEQLADVRLEMAKLKKATDKATSEASEYKRKLREKMSDEEINKQTQAENEKRLAIYEAMDRYSTLYPSMDSATAKKLAELDAEGDKVGTAEVMNQFIDALVKQRTADALLGRQKVNASTGAVNQMTKEQFEKLDLVEKTKLRRENLAEYDRLKQ